MELLTTTAKITITEGNTKAFVILQLQKVRLQLPQWVYIDWPWNKSYKAVHSYIYSFRKSFFFYCVWWDWKDVMDRDPLIKNEMKMDIQSELFIFC